MVLWQSPDTPVMSWLFCPGVCSSRAALSSACLVSCWSVVLGCLEFQFRVRIRTLALYVLSRIVSMQSQVRPRACSSVHVCFLLLHTVLVFIGCVHSCYVLCCVARSLCFSWVACFHVVMSCVNTWLMSILISCKFVPCFAHGWCFGSLVFVLFEHMAFVLVLCVLCALMSIVLSPPILFTDYWLICPTCLPRYPPHLHPS